MRGSEIQLLREGERESEQKEREKGEEIDREREIG